MTIASTTTSVQYLRNGTATQWSYPNKVFSAADLVVIDLDTSVPPVITTLVLGTDYTVSNVDVDTGCLVTTTSPGIAGHTLDIRSSIAQVQGTSIKNQGSYLPELHEEFFDRITREMQDLKRLGYFFSVHGPDTEATPWPAVPSQQLRASTNLGFDAFGNLAVSIALASGTLSQGNIISFLGSDPLIRQTPAELAAGVTPVNLHSGAGVVDRYLTNTTPGTTAMDTAYAAAIAQAQQAGGSPVTVSNKTLLANNLTVPAGVALQFTGNGSVFVTTGKTLTINGPFSAPTRQVFLNAQATQGTVIMAAGTAEKAYFEWWGAVANAAPTGSGTDCTAAIAAAITATSGGAGLNIGLIPMQLLAGNYLTGNQLFTPASILRGVGRKECGFVAKNGTSGLWFTDTGNAAGIIMEDFALYGNSANCAGMTTMLKLGYGGTQHGSEGYIKGIWPRDCACSGGGWHVDINQNIGFYDLISVYGNAAQSAGSNLIRIVGVGGVLSRTVALGAGANAYSIYLNAAGIAVNGIEIEGPNGCSSSFAPLSIQANATIRGAIISMNNAANTTFDHLWEVGANAYSWSLDLQLLQSFTAFLATVTNGNAYNIAKSAYFGGTLQTVASNTQGSGMYASAMGNVLSGTVAFAAATTGAVVLPWSQTVSTYKVALSQSATSTSPPWVTAKTTNGFTINFTAAFTGNVDWSITL